MKSPHVVLVQMELLVGRCGIDEAGCDYTLRGDSAELSFHEIGADARARLVAEIGEPSETATFPEERGRRGFTVAKWKAAPPRRKFAVSAYGWTVDEKATTLAAEGTAHR